MRKYLFFVLIVCLLFASPSFATNLGRSFGLGGAFISVADDPSAVYSNPAGLSQIKKIQVGASSVSDYSTSKTKYDLSGLVPGWKTDAEGVSSITYHFFGGAYPIQYFANPLVAGLALGSDVGLNISETGDLPAAVAPFNKLALSINERTDSKALGLGYQVMQNLSLGISVISGVSIKNIDSMGIDESGVSVPSLVPVLNAESYSGNLMSTLLGGLYKLSDKASIGGTILMPSDTVRYVTTAGVLAPGNYVQYSYLEKSPMAYSLGGSYRPIPELLLALDLNSVSALSYKSKLETDKYGDGDKNKIKSDGYTEVRVGAEYTIDLGGGAGVPLRVGYASIPLHSMMEPWDVVAVDDVVGFAATKSATKVGKTLFSIGAGYKKDSISVDVGIQSVTETNNIKISQPALNAQIKNSATVLRMLFSCGLSF